MRLYASILGLTMVALALSPTTSLAQSRNVVFAGADAGGDPSVYVGATHALPGSSIGRGWAVRGIASAGRYDYERTLDTVEAEFTQVDVALLRQHSGAWGYVNFGAGPRFTDTELDPNDPGNDRAGSRWDVAVTADAAIDSGPWRVGGFGVYGVRLREYYVRADLTRAVGQGPVRLGVEVLAEGDRNYDRQSVGGVVFFEDRRGFAIRGAVGLRDGDDTYVSIGVSRAF